MTGRAHIEMVDEGMAMIGYKDQRIFVINNDGMIVMDLRQALYERRVVSTFFRETLGKNLLVRYSHRNYRVDI